MPTTPHGVQGAAIVIGLQSRQTHWRCVGNWSSPDFSNCCGHKFLDENFPIYALGFFHDCFHRDWV